MPDQAHRWIPAPPPRSARLLLVSVHGAGAGPGMFATWPRRLPEGVALVAVELPGRDPRRGTPALTDFEPLVDGLRRALVPLLERPFVLYGHSMGALVAFELALSLRARGEPSPAALAVSAAQAPQLPAPARNAATLGPDELHALLRGFEGLPAGVLEHPGLRELLLPPLLADLELLDGYRFGSPEPLACPLWAWAGEEDTLVPPDVVRPWGELSTGPKRMEVVPGGHFFFRTRRSPFFGHLSEELEELLAGQG